MKNFGLVILEIPASQYQIPNGLPDFDINKICLRLCYNSIYYEFCEKNFLQVLKFCQCQSIHSNKLPDNFMLHTWGGWPAIDQSCQKEMSNIFRGIIEKTFQPLFQPA